MVVLHRRYAGLMSGGRLGDAAAGRNRMLVVAGILARGYNVDIWGIS